MAAVGEGEKEGGNGRNLALNQRQ